MAQKKCLLRRWIPYAELHIADKKFARLFPNRIFLTAPEPINLPQFTTAREDKVYFALSAEFRPRKGYKFRLDLKGGKWIFFDFGIRDDYAEQGAFAIKNPHQVKAPGTLDEFVAETELEMIRQQLDLEDDSDDNELAKCWGGLQPIHYHDRGPL